MIYLFYGSDRDKVLICSIELINKMVSDLPDAFFVRMDTEKFEKSKFEELISSRSLFSKKIIVLCDGLFSNKETELFLSKKIEDISASNNIFVFRDGNLDKKTVDVFKKNGAKIEEFSLLKPSNNGYAGAREVKLRVGYEGFNIFSFTDAIGKRDKKNAWVLYHKALRAGFPAEELFWKAIWIFRNIILASSLNSDQKGVVSTLKISPFVFGKAKSFVGGYNEQQLISKYKDLINLYHQSRRGMLDIEMETEQFILNL